MEPSVIVGIDDWTTFSLSKETLVRLGEKSPEEIQKVAEGFGCPGYFLASLIFQLEFADWKSHTSGLIKMAENEYPGLPFRELKAWAEKDRHDIKATNTFTEIGRVISERKRYIFFQFNLNAKLKEGIEELFCFGDFVMRHDGLMGGQISGIITEIGEKRIYVSVCTRNTQRIYGRQEEFRLMTTEERETFQRERIPDGTV